MSVGFAIATAFNFMWLGMVLAISFLEAPLKFRAPGVTLQIGLGIGRLVFRALNTEEVALAAGILVALVSTAAPIRVVVTFAAAFVALAAQLLAVRPRLTRRSDAVFKGDNAAGRSRGHYVYVAFEMVKVIALVIGGVLLLGS